MQKVVLYMPVPGQRVSAVGQWVHCSPALISAGVSCADGRVRALASAPNGADDRRRDNRSARGRLMTMVSPDVIKDSRAVRLQAVDSHGGRQT